jgi:uncharacterized protein YcgI (DUF1989 family)
MTMAIIVDFSACPRDDDDVNDDGRDERGQE